MDAAPQIPAMPPTPPSDVFSPRSEPESPPTLDTSSPLSTGLEILAAERDGLAHLHHVYSSSPIAQKGFSAAVDVLVSTAQRHGQMVVSGVGKSGLIGRKMIATLNSLGIRAGWMHPTEALHGDLGMVGPHDALLLITFSGNTAELLGLMEHLPPSSPVILMSSALPDDGKTVLSLPLFAARLETAHCNNVLLPTPLSVAEKTLFGVSAPTVSTTVTLALGDALAMAAAHKLHEHQDGVKDIFKKYHPGGAIGKANAIETRQSSPQSIQDEPPGSASSVSLDGSTVGEMTDDESEDGAGSVSSNSSMHVGYQAGKGELGKTFDPEVDMSEALLV